MHQHNQLTYRRSKTERQVCVQPNQHDDSANELSSKQHPRHANAKAAQQERPPNQEAAGASANAEDKSAEAQETANYALAKEA